MSGTWMRGVVDADLERLWAVATAAQASPGAAASSRSASLRGDEERHGLVDRAQ